MKVCYESERGEVYVTYNRKRETNWIGYILHRNCLLKHVIGGNIKGKIRVMGRRGRRRKQILITGKGKLP